MTRAWACANQLTKINLKEREQKKHMNFDEEILLTRQIQLHIGTILKEVQIAWK